MGWGKAVEVIAKFIVPIFAGLFGIRSISKAGARKERIKTLEAEAKNHHEFEKDGEDWDSHGGLNTIVSDKLSNTNNDKP